MPIDLETNQLLTAKICVVGVGGAGGNAVDNMVKRGVDGVTFITANTDKQALDKTLAAEKILLGATLTRGLGAGAKPEVGKQATEESSEAIKDAIAGYDLIFVTCGMGGGTGTGGAPVVAKIAKETGALVVGIVAKCFSKDGSSKTNLAEEGIAALKANVDAIIVVPNDKILQVCGGMRMREAYAKANDVLYDALRGITDIIVKDTYQNVDFADVRTALTGAGEVIIGIGAAKGDNAPSEAVKNALNSPFLEGLTVRDAKFVLTNIQAGNMPMERIIEAYDTLREATGEDANFISGEDDDENVEEFSITIIAPAQVAEINKNKLEEEKPSEEIQQTEKNTNIILPSTPAKSSKSKRNNNNITNEEEIDFKDETLEITKSNKPKYAAAKTAPVESLEVLVAPAAISGRIAKPHGNEELKEYDVPAFKRRKGESKYNVAMIDTITDSGNTLPNEKDMPHIQNFVRSANGGKPVNRFLHQIANGRLSNNLH